jgi:uncharacterized caspase-like protein
MLRRVLCRVLGLVGFVCAVLVAGAAHAERRVALVVGNAHYEYANALRNPLNDAKAMAELLRTLGFEVLLGTDLDQRAFAGAIDKFGRMLEGADVGLFFYAGHGLQVNDRNYLVSTQAKLESEFLIPAETVQLDAIVRLMESRTRVNLVFLDACRNNPLADKLRQNLVAANRAVSLGRGLARVEPTGRDTLIAFAAAPGQEAADGHGVNSPFTAALLQSMPKPGLEVSVMLKEVAAQVRRETHNAQRPQQLSDMGQTFYFAKAEQALTRPAPQPKPAEPDHAIELAYWNSARAGNDCDSVRAYLERFPDGIFVDLARLSERRLCDTSRKVTVVETPVAPPPPTVAAPPAPPQAVADERKLASLPNPAAAAPSPEPEADKSAAMADLARDLQRELARVGCSPGRPDGVWGARSRNAVRDFNRHVHASLDADGPSKETLAALQKHRGRACPPPEPVATRSKEPARQRPDAVRSRERLQPVERRNATTVKDWRAISPLCQSAYYEGGKLCCTYDPPRGAPQIICP